MVAAIAQSPNIALDDEEAERLSKAIANVTRHYDVPQMAQSTVDWIMLMQAGGAIYGPRLMAWRMERASRRMKPAPMHRAAPQNVAPAATAPRSPMSAPSTVNTPMPNPFDVRRQPMPSANDPSALDGVALAQEPTAAMPGRNQPMPGANDPVVAPEPIPEMQSNPGSAPRFNPALAGVDGAGAILKIGG